MIETIYRCDGCNKVCKSTFLRECKSLFKKKKFVVEIRARCVRQFMAGAIQSLTDAYLCDECLRTALVDVLGKKKNSQFRFGRLGG